MVDADAEALVFEDFSGDEYPRLVPMLQALTRAFRIPRCSRGVAVDEAGEPMDLCL